MDICLILQEGCLFSIKSCGVQSNKGRSQNATDKNKGMNCLFLLA